MHIGSIENKFFFPKPASAIFKNYLLQIISHRRVIILVL